VAVVVRVKLEADAGRVGVGGGGNKVLWFIGDRVTGGDETGKGAELVADGSEGVTDGIAGGGFVVLAGKKWSP
jgi:hypothetical protein